MNHYHLDNLNLFFLKHCLDCLFCLTCVTNYNYSWRPLEIFGAPLNFSVPPPHATKPKSATVIQSTSLYCFVLHPADFKGNPVHSTRISSLPLTWIKNKQSKVSKLKNAVCSEQFSDVIEDKKVEKINL